MSGKVVSFINMKGGVGKSTLCIGIGEYLATYRKKKILFIDLDPQFNTTQSLINEFDLEDEYMNEYSSGDNNKTVMKLFQSQLTLAKKVDILMLSRLVDTFFSRTSWTMLLYAENHSISVA